MSVFASSIQNLFSQAPTSENEQRIKAYLEKFPKSDADDNGILTLQELLTHMRKTRKGSEKSNNDDPFKPSSDNTNIRYSDKHKRNVLDYYPAKKKKLLCACFCLVSWRWIQWRRQR